MDLVSNVTVIDNKRLFLVQKSLEEIQKVCERNVDWTVQWTLDIFNNDD